MEITNAKMSQLTIQQPELQSSSQSARQPVSVAPGNLPQGVPSQLQIMQGQMPQQVIQGNPQMKQGVPPPTMPQYHLQEPHISQNQIQTQSNSQLKILQPVNKPLPQSSPLQQQLSPF